jgi:hypothetical protein
MRGAPSEDLISNSTPGCPSRIHRCKRGSDLPTKSGMSGVHFDLGTKSGAKVEVKSAAYLQSW